MTRKKSTVALMARAELDAPTVLATGRTRHGETAHAGRGDPREGRVRRAQPLGGDVDDGVGVGMRNVNGRRGEKKREARVGDGHGRRRGGWGGRPAAREHDAAPVTRYPLPARQGVRACRQGRSSRLSRHGAGGSGARAEPSWWR